MHKLLKNVRTNQCIGYFISRRYNSNAIEPSGLPKESPSTAKSIESFKDVVFKRRSEAKRSIIVRTDNLTECANVYHHCNQFGAIKNGIAYSMKNDQNFILLEYEIEDSVHEAFRYCGFSISSPQWQNQYLQLRQSALRNTHSKDAPLQYSSVDFKSVANILNEAESIEKQILLLYEHSGVNDLATRLKFMSAMQAENIVNHFMSSIFPDAKLYPFGSTLNGFGLRGCDLDMILHYDRDAKGMFESNNTSSMLQFYNRCHNTEDELKARAGRQVKCMSALIDHYMPGIGQAIAFSTARVPLVRYYDNSVPCSVDLSIMNVDGFLATELMYTLGVLDARVRPFVFLARRWAKEFKLTRHGPGESLTNFQISYMALSFLANLKEPVIPTFIDLIEMLNVRIETEKSIDYSNKAFLFDLSQIRFQSKNTSTIFQLFYQFLEYYESYDFTKYMVTLETTELIQKPEARPLHLENMFRKEGVWGDNVSQFEINTMKVMIREALDELNLIDLEPGGADGDWGLLGILSHLKPAE